MTRSLRWTNNILFGFLILSYLSYAVAMLNEFFESDVLVFVAEVVFFLVFNGYLFLLCFPTFILESFAKAQTKKRNFFLFCGLILAIIPVANYTRIAFDAKNLVMP